MATAKATTNGAAPKTPTTEYKEAKDDLSLQIEMLKKDVSGLIESVGKLATSGKEVAKTTAKTHAATAKAKGQEHADAAMTQLNARAQQVTDYAREKPFHALAIAAGAGLLLGMLTSPRK